MYSWGTKPCVRFSDNFDGEEHPCYWCGNPMTNMLNPKDSDICDNCHGILCPTCGKCWCNVSTEQFSALKKLRNKYCCTKYHFRRGLEDKDKQLLSMVPGFRLALEYCRRRKGV